jgi:segregation and condensation protein A
MPYLVELSQFHGPLDLLLYLVKRDEIDLLDIPIARIAEQFLHHLRIIELIDVELAGEFLVVAATLMEIKSKLLLPRQEVEREEEADPRRELVKQLLEYRKFKDAAGKLEERGDRHTSRFARQPIAESAEKDAPVAVKRVELWDLVSAFARLMRELSVLQPKQIIVDDTPQHVYENHVRERLSREGPLNFRDLFTPPYHRSRLVGLFLAILELIKQQVIWLDQLPDFGEILIRLREADRENAA